VHGTDGDLVEDLFGHPVLAHARRASIGRRGELGHRDDLFEVLAAGRGGVGRRRVEQPVPGRVGEESPPDAVHGGADRGDVAQVPDDDVDARLTQHLGAMVVVVDERSHRVSLLVEERGDVAPG
jgi:hypothetical protein